MEIIFKDNSDYGWFSYVEDCVLFIGKCSPHEGGLLYHGEFKGDDTPYLLEIKKEDIEQYNSIVKYFEDNNMSEQERIITKIKESAYANVNKKLEEERKKVEDRINNELKDVEKCLQYIRNKMVYKTTGSNIWNTKYILVDENIFFEDYTNESEYHWNKGIIFSNPNSKPYEPLFKVNGHSYYDMRYIIRHYEETFNSYSRRLNDLYEKFNEIKEAAENLKRQEPHIKELIEQYKQVNIDESFM